MKKEGHPDYQEVLFVDTATGHKFVCGTTLKPKETETFEGKQYPVYRVPISSFSHPFFTGDQQFIDTEGRVDKFKKRYTAKREQAQKEETLEPMGEASKKEEGKRKRVVRKKKP